jgi:HEAT repeat protein
VHLVEIGRAVPEVIPALVGLLATLPDLRGQLTVVLGFIGSDRTEVGEALVPLLAHPDPSVANAAAHALGNSGSAGSKAEEAVRQLVERCAVENDLYGPAGYALTGLGSEGHPEEVVTALAQRATEAAPEERDWLWLALLGELARARVAQAVAALVDFMRDPDQSVRAAAVRTAREVTAPEALAAVCGAMRDEDPGVRLAAVTPAGGCLREHAAQLVPALAAALADSDRDVREQAVRRLRPFGPAAAEALPALRAMQATLDAELTAARAEYRAAKKAMAAAKARYEVATERATQISEAIRKIGTEPAAE